MEHMSQSQNNHPDRRGIKPLEGEELMKKIMAEETMIQVIPKAHGEKFAQGPKTSTEVESLRRSLQEQISAEERKNPTTEIDRRVSGMKIDRLKKQLANIHDKPGHA